jgi:NADH-quinone oxidoreductase subunit M
VVGVLERHYQTRDIEAFSGLARKYPALAFCLAFFVFSLIGVPGLGGFPGEWLSLMGLFQSSPGCVFFGLLGTLLVAWAFVWLLQRMLLGTFREPRAGSHWVGESGATPKALESISTQPLAAAPRETFAGLRSTVPLNTMPRDLLARELFVLAPVGILLLGIGFCPGFFLNRINPTLSQIVPGSFPGDENSNSAEGNNSSQGGRRTLIDEGDLPNIDFAARRTRSVRR